MKRIYHILIVLFFITRLVGQHVDSTSIVASSEFFDSKVHLRWAIKDVDTWYNLQGSGYDIKRFKTHDNGTKLPEPWAYITVASNILPYASSNFNLQSFGQDSSLANALKSTLYETQNSPFTTVSPKNASDIAKNQQSYQNKYMAVLLLCDRSFKVAQAAGNAFIDSLDDVNDSYLYQITTVNNGIQYTALSRIDASNNLLKKPRNITAIGEDKMIELKWYKNSNGLRYSFYDIERSINGNVFESATNGIPFFFSNKGVEDIVGTDEIIFTDSIEANNVEYYYRVRGMTHMGQKGPWSDTIIVKGIDGPMAITLNGAINDQIEGSTLLTWNMTPDVHISKIEHFDIYKGKSATSNDFIKINQSPIAPITRSFDASGDGRSWYYIITMQDINGHVYRTNSMLSQPLDSIPPLTPRNPTATISRDGTVTLDWDDNEEEDLAGYRLYRGNFSGDFFIDVPGRIIHPSQYTDFLDPDINIDSVFYKICASDKRGNFSPYTQLIALNRPDNIAPNDPVIYALYPTLEGIKVKWGLSTSPDLSRHVLQRRRTDERNWSDVITFTPKDDLTNQEIGNGIYAYNFIDKSRTVPTEYIYRLLAYDDFDNIASSLPVSVIPLIPDGETTVYNIVTLPECNVGSNEKYYAMLLNLQNGINQLQFSTTQSSINTILINLVASGALTMNQYTMISGNSSNQTATLLNAQVQAVQQKVTNNNCLLRIDYHYKDLLSNIKAVKIYKGTDSQVDLYKTIPKEAIISLGEFHFTYVDHEVIPKATYFYKIKVLLEDGTTSKMSDLIEVTVL